MQALLLLWALLLCSPCLLLFVPVLLQFERFCRPYYTAGFNAYELVEAAMVSRRAETVGEYKPTHSEAAQPDSRAVGSRTAAAWSTAALLGMLRHRSVAHYTAFCRDGSPHQHADLSPAAFACARVRRVLCVCAGDRSGAQIVDDTLRQAAARGINTVRMWAHTTNKIYPFQVGHSSRQTGPHPHSSAGTEEPQQQALQEQQHPRCAVLPAGRTRAPRRSPHV